MEISEKKIDVEDLGHDARLNGYKYNTKDHAVCMTRWTRSRSPK